MGMWNGDVSVADIRSGKKKIPGAVAVEGAVVAVGKEDFGLLMSSRIGETMS